MKREKLLLAARHAPGARGGAGTSSRLVADDEP
jgi:hypothetical protein